MLGWVGDRGLPPEVSPQAEIIREGQAFRWKQTCKPVPWPGKVVIFEVLQLLFVFVTVSPAALAGQKLAM